MSMDTSPSPDSSRRVNLNEDSIQRMSKAALKAINDHKRDLEEIK